MEYVVCAFLFLYCLGAASGRDIIFNVSRGNDEVETVFVNPGSNVTFVCDIPQNAQKVVEWYREDHKEFVALLSNERDNCALQHVQYVPEKLISTGCAHNKFTIVLTNVQKTDEGKWYCRAHVEQTPERSQKISLKVEEPADSNLAPRIKNTVSQKKPPTTLLERVPLQPTATTTSREPGGTGNNPSDMIPILGGVSGCVIFLVATITIVLLSLRRRVNCHSGQGNTNSERRSIEGSAETQSSAPERDNTYQHPAPEESAHVYTAVDDDIRGRASTSGTRYSVLHADSQEYSHMYGVIKTGSQGQMSRPGGDYYNFVPQAADDHLYTSVNS